MEFLAENTRQGNSYRPAGNVIIRFNKVSFEYGKKPILNEADFSVREGSKITLMGQNGAGKARFSD